VVVMVEMVVGGREVVEVVVGGRRLRVRALASTSPMSTPPSWVKRIESPAREYSVCEG
jgi:hypothetical protein